jgi:hypothetical protein
MNIKCRLFKGVYLDPSSKAFSLLSEKKEKEAEALMKECLKKYNEQMEIK